MLLLACAWLSVSADERKKLGIQDGGNDKKIKKQYF